MKKLLLFIIVLLVTLSSCKEATDADGNTILRVMVNNVAAVPESEGTLTDNRWTRYAQAEMLKKGIKLEYVSKGGSLVNATIMMATGTAPDVVNTHSRLLFSKYAADGGLYNINPYIDEYGPLLKQNIDKELFSYGVLDGNLYAIPAKTKSRAKNTSLIRKDWLDILGMDVPTNRDELLEVLLAFKQKDPGGIGSENVIPWGHLAPDPGTVFDTDFKQFDVMYSFFKHDPEQNMSLTYPHREGFKEFMLWMRDLNDMELLDIEFATMNEAENNKKIVNGQVGFVHYMTDRLFKQSSSEALYVIGKNGSKIEYLPIEVFQNDEGDYRKILGDPAYRYNFIPSNSKVPEAAVIYLNWMMEDETRRIMHYGIESEHYEIIDGKPKVIDLDHNIKTFTYFDHWFRLLGFYPQDVDAYTNYSALSREVDFNGMEELAREIHVNDSFTGVLYQERMDMMAKHGTGLIKICEKYWVKLLTEDNFEDNYGEFMDKLKDRNIDLIDQEKAAYYKRHN